MERKRKVYLGESASSFHLKTRRVGDSGGLSCQTVAGDALMSCCSSNRSGDLTWKIVDLEDNEAILTTSTGCESETPPLKARGEPHSTARRREADPRRCSMPSEAELDEFFAAAEKKIHQEFILKYNYDIVKEESLEGRYEWVRPE